MTRSRQIKRLPTIMWILFCFGIIQNYAYADPQSDPESIARGAKEWANTCNRCHNLRPPSEFSSEQWKTIVLHMRLQAGLTGQQERDIYNFLAAASPSSNQTVTGFTEVSTKGTSTDTAQGSSTNPLPGNNIELGKKIYHQTCVACHGNNGTGAMSGVPNMTGKNSPLVKNSEAVLLQRIEQGYQGPGAPMAMPPKGGNPNLTSEEIKAVLDYMKQTFGS